MSDARFRPVAGIELIEHRYHRTYSVAAAIERLVHDPFAYLHTLSDMFLDEAILEYIAPFPKWSALHRFAVAVIHLLFEGDAGNCRLVPSLTRKRSGVPPWEEAVWVTPMEAAFETYRIPYTSFDEFRDERGWPQLGMDWHRTINDDSATQDALYEYWQELLITQPLETLVRRMAEEVFFVMFTNRAALEALQQMLAGRLQEIDPETLDPQIRRYFNLQAASVSLKRVGIPMWARRAIECRDRGLCSYCHRPLSASATPINRLRFDHIVPLHAGGLNDVTNLQVLCEDHNLEKSAKSMPAGRHYARWYPR